ncbi:MAG: hypothetical protein JW841_06450 [Deltaproteobacteria bacterium]|nr:hypothetical protein [Deltaproteobacteria bacterium]
MLMGLENADYPDFEPIEKGGWDLTIQTNNTWVYTPTFKDILHDLSTEEKLAAAKDKFLPAVQNNMMDGTKWLGMPIGITRFNGSYL